MTWELTLPEPPITLPQRVYHYTSLATFATILARRTLRLNRLDGVEDCADGATNLPGSRQIAYASCWTEAEDCLAIWRLYGDNARGVRIGIDPSRAPFANVVPSKSRPRPQSLNLDLAHSLASNVLRGGVRFLEPASPRDEKVGAEPRLFDLQQVHYSAVADDAQRHDVAGTVYIDARTGDVIGRNWDVTSIGLICYGPT